ncbi:MAG TPA: class I SAM-dependent methyltransferase [Vicinamibacteria bacterium]|nr:class I SAM-dependent methyltransferase [Vicinamibacteria bacterium]
MSRLAVALVAVLVACAGVAAPAPTLPQAAAAPQNQAAPSQPPAEPQIGQQGKDVIWLPTPESVVEKMLDLAGVGPQDVVYDLGSGDGRTVIAAAHRGAQAYGVEFDPGLVVMSEKYARTAGVADKAHFIRGDIFETDFSKATVVTLYLLTTLNVRLRPTILKMKPGTRVVSHAFSMEDWDPDDTGESDYRRIFMWVVPAQVQGSWRLTLPGAQPADMTITQRYQKLQGTVGLPSGAAELRDAALRGNAIHLTLPGADGASRELTGTVDGDRMQGTVKAGASEAGWTAERR